LLTSSLVNAAVWTGQLHSTKTYEFIDRFAYADTSNFSSFPGLQGRLDFSFVATDLDAVAEAAQLRLCLYFGDEFSSVWNDDLTCQRKIDISHYCYVMKPKLTVSVGVVDNHGANFWYLMMYNCNDTAKTEWSVEYNITCTNPGGLYTRQFSVDKWGFYQLDISFFVFYTVLLGFHVYTCVMLHRARAYHVLMKMLTLVIACEWLATLIFLCTNAVYAVNGVGSPAFTGIADAIDLIAQVVFIILLMLLAQGWSISSSAIMNRKVLIIGFVSLIVLNIVLFIWKYIVYDPAVVVYMYETIPGILLLILRTAMFVWFMLSVRVSYNAEDDLQKKAFYKRFSIVYGFWFESLVVIVIIGAMIPAIRRDFTVSVIYQVVNFNALAILGIMLRPSVAVQYFGGGASEMMFSGKTSTHYEQL